MIVNWGDADSQVLLADDCYRAAPAVTKTTDDSCELSRARALEFSKNRVNSADSLLFCFSLSPFPFLSISLLLFLSFSPFFSLSLLSSMLDERESCLFFRDMRTI